MQDLPMQDLLVESKSLTAELTADGSVAGSLSSRLPPKKATEKSHTKEGGLARW